MNRYDKTYRRYCDLMRRLRTEFYELGSLRNITIRGRQTTSIIDDIDMTIRTAVNGINLPSEELMTITNEMADLRQHSMGLVPVKPEAWKKCFCTLHEASVELMTITDDPYVRSSCNLSKEIICKD